MHYKIATIYGDGIGPDVTKATVSVLEAVGLDMEFIKCEAGYGAWKTLGNQLPPTSLEILRGSDACLKGPTQTPPGPASFLSVAVTLRKTFDLYANIRPMKSRPGVKCLYPDVDFIIVRENTEGLYSGLEEKRGDAVHATRVVSGRGSERIIKKAFELALAENRKKVTVVHKANILKMSDGLFRDTFLKIAPNYPTVVAEELLVDATAYRIVTKPQDLDVIVTTNLFGDILSDEAAAVVGGLGLAPGANIGDSYAVFEAVHGVAMKYADQGIANPSALLLSSVMMLKYLREGKAAERLERAIETVIKEGRTVTKDLGGSASTPAMAQAIIEALE